MPSAEERSIIATGDRLHRELDDLIPRLDSRRLVVDPGMSGHGKSTLGLMMLYHAIQADPSLKVVFISPHWEFNSADMALPAPKIPFSEGTPGGRIERQHASYEYLLRELYEETRFSLATYRLDSHDIHQVGSMRWHKKCQWDLPAHKRQRTKTGKPSSLIAALTKKL